jgi:hypothetical protein
MMAARKHPIHPVILVDDAQLLKRDSLMDLCSLIVCPPKKKAAAASLNIVGDDMLAKQMQLTIMTPSRTRLTMMLHLNSGKKMLGSRSFLIALPNFF